jgi:hypothetical protein
VSGDTAEGTEESPACSLGYLRLYYRLTVPPNQVRRVIVRGLQSAQSFRFGYAGDCTLGTCGRSDSVQSGLSGALFDFPNFGSVAQNRILIVASENGTPFRYSLDTTTLPVASNGRCETATTLAPGMMLTTSTSGGGPPGCGPDRAALGIGSPFVFFRATVPARSRGSFFLRSLDAARGSAQIVTCGATSCPVAPLEFRNSAESNLQVMDNATNASRNRSGPLLIGSSEWRKKAA